MSKVGEALGVEATPKCWGLIKITGKVRIGNSRIDAVDFFHVEDVLHAEFHDSPTNILLAEVMLVRNGRTKEISLEGEGAAELRRVLEAAAKV